MIQEYVDIFVDSSIMKIRGLNRLEDLASHNTSFKYYDFCTKQERILRARTRMFVPVIVRMENLL